MTFQDDEYTFTDYQLATSATAIYPGAGTGSWEALSYIGLGLGEAGEIQGKLKKVLRDDAGLMTAERKKDLRKELGDLLWYAARLADELGESLEVVAKENVSKLLDRQDRGVLTGSGDNR